MTHADTTPGALRAVAYVFLFFGLCAVVEILVRLARGNWYLTTEVLGIPICYGLLRRSAGWRTCALVVLWFGFVLLPLIAVGSLTSLAPAYFDVFGVRMADLPNWVVAAMCVPFFGLNLWQYRVLVSPRVRVWFAAPAAPLAG